MIPSLGALEWEARGHAQEARGHAQEATGHAQEVTGHAREATHVRTSFSPSPVHRRVQGGPAFPEETTQNWDVSHSI